MKHASFTAKTMKASSGKGLAYGGHPPQGATVFTAPPQKKRTPESVLDDWEGEPIGVQTWRMFSTSL
jgi:hypothetical protein